jgi:hypothetical protein
MNRIGRLITERMKFAKMIIRDPSCLRAEPLTIEVNPCTI